MYIFVIQLIGHIKVKNADKSSSSFIIKNYFNSPTYFILLFEAGYLILTYVKNSFRFLVVIGLNLQIVFGVVAIFTILILLMCVCGRSFHLFYISSVSFFGVLRLNSLKSFTYFTRFIPRYFKFFDVIGKCFVHPISLPVLLTFGFRATDF